MAAAGEIGLGSAQAGDVASAAVARLTEWAPLIGEMLRADPGSESGLTALCDLALLSSVLTRDRVVEGAERLSAALAGVLGSTAPTEAPHPGPAAWARHAAGAWLDPGQERLRLADPAYQCVVSGSAEVMLVLGPSWRKEEISHVASRLHALPLPGPRSGSDAGNAVELYELAHVAFYCTDFGAATGAIADDLARCLASQLARGLSILPMEDAWLDLAAELMLGHWYLTGDWPSPRSTKGPDAASWRVHIGPKWIWQTIDTFSVNDPEMLFRYHTLAVTAMLVSYRAEGMKSPTVPKE